jgi:hypothetical protein
LAVLALSEDEVRRTLKRALWLAGGAVVVLTPVLWVWQGWRTWLAFLIGALISATGLFEYLQLLSAMMSRMEEGREPTPMGRVTVMFFLRLLGAAGLLYVSLKVLRGSVYALLGGLAVCLIALTIESIRLAARR